MYTQCHFNSKVTIILCEREEKVATSISLRAHVGPSNSKRVYKFYLWLTSRVDGGIIESGPRLRESWVLVYVWRAEVNSSSKSERERRRRYSASLPPIYHASHDKPRAQKQPPTETAALSPRDSFYSSPAPLALLPVRYLHLLTFKR